MENHHVEASSGNVFADLGLADAEDLTTRAQLALRIGDIIRGRHLTQIEAAEVLGATQPIVSKVMRGHLHGFSLERLLRFLNALDCDVEIVVRSRPRNRDHAETRVSVAG